MITERANCLTVAHNVFKQFFQFPLLGLRKFGAWLGVTTCGNIFDQSQG